MTAEATTRRRGLALLAAMLVAVAGMIPVTLTGALAVQLRTDLGLTESGIGAAVAVFFTAGALTALAGGRFADRHGWRAGVLAFSALAAGSLALIALAAFAAWMLVLWLAVGGVAMAGSMSTSNLVLAREGPPDRLGFMLGLKQTAVPVATLLSGAAVPALALTVGWRWAFGLAVLVPVGAVAASIPGSARGRTLRRAGPAPARDRAPVSRSLVELAVACGFASVIPGVLTGFIVVSAVDAGISEASAGTILMVGSLIGLGVRVGAGWSIDRVASRGFREVSTLLAVGAVALGCMATGNPVLFVGGALVAFGTGWGWPGLFFYGVVVANMDAPAAATGVIQTGGAIGTAVGPLVFGVVAELAGHGVAWSVTALAAVSAAILTTAAVRRSER